MIGKRKGILLKVSHCEKRTEKDRSLAVSHVSPTVVVVALFFFVIFRLPQLTQHRHKSSSFVTRQSLFISIIIQMIHFSLSLCPVGIAVTVQQTVFLCHFCVTYSFSRQILSPPSLLVIPFWHATLQMGFHILSSSLSFGTLLPVTSLKRV